MKPVKILHSADLHFDTPFSGLSVNAAEKRREDLRVTFGEITRIAKEEQVDLLFICGDLFDNANVYKTTLEYIIQKLDAIPETKVFISPGNHDPYNDKSYYNLVKWPQNVHIFKRDMEKVYIAELATCIYGIGFTELYQRTSLLQGFHVEDEAVLNMMVLHGDVVTPGQTNPYNPLSTEEIEESGLDYLALGHRHTYCGIMSAGRTYWAYPGNPEGRGFDEQGVKGVIIGSVAKGLCKLAFREVCKRKYFTVEVDISGAKTNDELVQLISQHISNQVKHENAVNNLYKIVLTGEVARDFQLNLEVLWDKIKDAFFFVKLLDATRVQLDFVALEKEFSLKGLFVKNMRAKIALAQEDDVQKLELALKMGLQALDSGKVVIN